MPSFLLVFFLVGATLAGFLLVTIAIMIAVIMGGRGKIFASRLEHFSCFALISVLSSMGLFLATGGLALLLTRGSIEEIVEVSRMGVVGIVGGFTLVAVMMKLGEAR